MGARAERARTGLGAVVAALELLFLVDWLLDQLLLVGVSVVGGRAAWGATWLNSEGPLPVTLCDLSAGRLPRGSPSSSSLHL